MGAGHAGMAEAGAVLTVNLAALVANWRRLDEESGAAECAAAVKADAYGIGLEEAARALHGAGCRTFFVAHASEGRRLREVLPLAVIYVLNGLIPGTASLYARHGLRPVLGSGEEIAEWAGFVRAEGWRGLAALHVDTGMNRLGLPLAEALALAAEPGDLAGIPLALGMSHFVESEDRSSSRSAEQIAAFANVQQAFPERDVLRWSLANSAGIFLGAQARFDLVRPGYALYGGNPTPGRPNPMRPVVRLQARIVQTRFVEAGDTAGYNGVWTAPARRRLATLSIGYADGLPRSLSAADETSGGIATIDGVPCPYAGRVSMDLLVIDVTEVPDDRARRGAVVEIIGDHAHIDEVAGRAGTIGYEVLTRLGRRYHRAYVTDQDVA